MHRGERVDHHETVRRRKDESLVDISLTVSPITDTLGRITGVEAERFEFVGDDEVVQHLRYAWVARIKSA